MKRYQIIGSKIITLNLKKDKYNLTFSLHTSYKRLMNYTPYQLVAVMRTSHYISPKAVYFQQTKKNLLISQSSVVTLCCARTQYGTLAKVTWIWLTNFQPPHRPAAALVSGRTDGCEPLSGGGGSRAGGQLAGRTPRCFLSLAPS